MKPCLEILLLFKPFSRAAHGQNALRQILALVVNERTDNKLLNIKSDLLDLYKPWVSQMESKMGEARYGSCYCDVSYKSCTAVLHCSVDRSKAPLASLHASVRLRPCFFITSDAGRRRPWRTGQTGRGSCSRGISCPLMASQRNCIGMVSTVTGALSWPSVGTAKN